MAFRPIFLLIVCLSSSFSSFSPFSSSSFSSSFSSSSSTSSSSWRNQGSYKRASEREAWDFYWDFSHWFIISLDKYISWTLILRLSLHLCFRHLCRYNIAYKISQQMAPFEVKYFEPKEFLARMRMQRLNVHHPIVHHPIVMSLTGIGWAFLHHFISIHIFKNLTYTWRGVQCFCVIVTPFLCFMPLHWNKCIGHWISNHRR